MLQRLSFILLRIRLWLASLTPIYKGKAIFARVRHIGMKATYLAEKSLKRDGVTFPKISPWNWASSSIAKSVLCSSVALIATAILFVTVLNAGILKGQSSFLKYFHLELLINAVVSAWQVLATLVGLTFVITILLIETIRDQQSVSAYMNEYVAHSRATLIISFSLLTIGCMLAVPFLTSTTMSHFENERS